MIAHTSQSLPGANDHGHTNAAATCSHGGQTRVEAWPGQCLDAVAASPFKVAAMMHRLGIASFPILTLLLELKASESPPPSLQSWFKLELLVCLP